MGDSPASAPVARETWILRPFAGRAMASPIRLKVAVRGDSTVDDRHARSAWNDVLDEFEACEQAMSRFRDSSEMTRLNRLAGAGPQPISRRLANTLALCDRARRLTDGRFDPRVLRDLERLGDLGVPITAGEGRGPDSVYDGGRVVERVGEGLVDLPVPVDLGGIGKGLALRWAARRIRSRGLGRFLLEAGGDIVASGSPRPGGSWQVGIEDPHGGVEAPAVISLFDGAVSTSSVRRRRWRHGERTVHHLIDPGTHEPGGAGLLAVTVAGPDPAWSEIWSKALFLEGRVGIAALARRRGLAAWWVCEDGVLEMTAGARMRTIWEASQRG